MSASILPSVASVSFTVVCCRGSPALAVSEGLMGMNEPIAYFIEDGLAAIRLKMSDTVFRKLPKRHKLDSAVVEKAFCCDRRKRFSSNQARR